MIRQGVFLFGDIKRPVREVNLSGIKTAFVRQLVPPVKWLKSNSLKAISSGKMQI
jgi:hypothetical protein